MGIWVFDLAAIVDDALITQLVARTLEARAPT